MQSPSDVMLALAEFSGLTIPDACHAGVIENLALIRGHMQSVMDFSLPESIVAGGDCPP